jgi:tRNA nucleotidyltransferase (CCA-adding enzyme)
VNELLNRLNAYSYRAYIVGRCVRELIGGQSVVDFDIITNATPDRICSIFDIYSVNTEKIDQGEIIVTVHGTPVLITPYKKGFSPAGNPIYTDDITEDLKRRDFSFNAIAYNPREGFVDPFGGVECLSGEQGVVKAIESEEEDGKKLSPFEQNPVSILQALGYYSSGDYIICDVTRESLLLHKSNIEKISPADLRTELSWVIRGKKVSTVLEEYAEVFTALVPELAPLTGFDLKRPEYCTDALTHTFRSVGYSSPVLTLRYAMLFHALGKPDCFSEDEKGTGHYYGHAERSWLYARRIMQRMEFSDEQTREVGFLIKNQDIEITTERRSLKLKLREMPPDRLKMLLQFKHADLKARSPDFEGAAMSCKRQVDAVNEIVAMRECYTLNQLAVNRYDLMQKGLLSNDEQANQVLERLLDLVIDTPALNTRARLMGAAEKIVQSTYNTDKAR